MRVQVHSLLERSEVNGPGTRAVVWVQGCSLHCSSCWNPETHPRKAGTSHEVVDLSRWIVGALRRVRLEGITISGGEPMEQALAILDLVEQVRTAAPQLSIGLFSGYSERELNEGHFLYFTDESAIGRHALWSQISSHLDFAVLGRYNRHQPTSNPLITSRNQRLKLLSRRYTVADFAPQTVEVTIDGSGLTQITGFPALGSLSQR